MTGALNGVARLRVGSHARAWWCSGQGPNGGKEKRRQGQGGCSHFNQGQSSSPGEGLNRCGGDPCDWTREAVPCFGDLLSEVICLLVLYKLIGHVRKRRERGKGGRGGTYDIKQETERHTQGVDPATQHIS
jgi:hypothetical protein